MHSVYFQRARGPIRLRSFQFGRIFLVTFNVGVACYFQAVLAAEGFSRSPANASPSFGLHLWLSSLVPPARRWPTSASSCSIRRSGVWKIKKNGRRKTTDAARFIVARAGKKRTKERGNGEVLQMIPNASLERIISSPPGRRIKVVHEC